MSQRLICRVNGVQCVVERTKGDPVVLRLVAAQGLAYNPKTQR